MAGAYVPIVNFSAFSSTELSAMLTAAKAALLMRMTGQVQSGASAAQSYGMHLMSDAQLTGVINALTDILGLDTQVTMMQPNFNLPQQGVNPYTATGNPI